MALLMLMAVILMMMMINENSNSHNSPFEGKVHDYRLVFQSWVTLLHNPFTCRQCHQSINQSINKLYLPSNLQCSTQVLISSSHVDPSPPPAPSKGYIVFVSLGSENGCTLSA